MRALLPNLLVAGLENHYEVFDPASLPLSGRDVHILFLGGGHSNDPRFPASAFKKKGTRIPLIALRTRMAADKKIRSYQRCLKGIRCISVQKKEHKQILIFAQQKT